MRNVPQKVIWITGLSGSGKTTLAMRLKEFLQEKGYSAVVLDGDQIRKGLNSDLGFSGADRLENIRRVAEISRLILMNGVVPICSLITPTNHMQELARRIIGSENYVEVYLNTPLEVCEQRDPKGLYRLAREGMIPDFTGIGSPYEPPLNPEITCDTSDNTVEQSTSVLGSAVIWQMSR